MSKCLGMGKCCRAREEMGGATRVVWNKPTASWSNMLGYMSIEIALPAHISERAILLFWR